MTNVHDRSHPAGNCRIMPHPGTRAIGLTMSQVKAARTPMTNHKGEFIGVLKVHMIGGSQGLGMISTVRSAHSPHQVIPVKGCVRQILARRGRHSPKSGPSNPVFQGRIPTGYVYNERWFNGQIYRLTDMYKAISRCRVGIGMEDKYETLRQEMINHYGPRALSVINSMEETVRKNTGRR
jgi:hypothetical protein